MFQGFNECTTKYYRAVCRDNCKNVHKGNETLYLEGVKYPLEELYLELYHYFSQVDENLLGSKRRCISPVYNDARFCHTAPVKEYFYIRFKLNGANRKNTPGFFFDASLDGYRYGLNIYDPDAKGMNKIRNHILDNRHYAIDVIKDFGEAGLLEVQGEKYKKEHYQMEDIVLQEWLERKRLSFIHEEILNAVFYKRELLGHIISAFDSARDIYFLIKEALFM